MNPQPTMRKELESMFDVMNIVSSLYKNETRLPERRAFRRAYDNALSAFNSVRDTVRDKWAADRGFKYNPRRWTMRYPVLDHCEVFDDGARRCARRRLYGFEPGTALVSHSYAPREEIERYAAEHDLLAEFMEWSWYNPGGCTAALFTPRATNPESQRWHSVVQ